MNHFHFPSSKAEATSQFYCKYFGFEEIKLLGKTHVLKNSSGFILAIDDEPHVKIEVASHLGFTYSDKSQVENLFEELRKNPDCLITPLQSPTPRALHFYCYDPSGNNLEIGWFQW